MASAAKNFSIRIDPETKKMCDDLFGELGLTLTAAINIFLKKSLSVGGLPFSVRREPNRETIKAMREAERIAHDPSVKHYADVEDALRALKE